MRVNKQGDIQGKFWNYQIDWKWITQNEQRIGSVPIETKDGNKIIKSKPFVRDRWIED